MTIKPFSEEVLSAQSYTVKPLLSSQTFIKQSPPEIVEMSTKYYLAT